MSKNNWEKIKLKNICSFINGNAYKDIDWSSEGIPIVRIQNLNDVNKPFNYWAGSLKGRVTINNSDLLLAWSGTPGTSFGAHIWNRGLALLNQHIFKVIYNEKEANPIWLKYAINQILNEMIEKSHGAVGLCHITKPEVENLEVLLPPTDEQYRLVKIIEAKLKSVERARILLYEQIETTDKLFEAYVRVKYFQKWKNGKIGEVAKINPSQKKITNNISDVSFVPMGAVNAETGIIDKLEVRKLSEVNKGYTYFENNDVIFAKITPCMQNGKHAIAKNLINNFGFGSTEFHVIRPSSEILPEWLHFYLRQSNYLMNAEKNMQGSVGHQRLPENYLYNTTIPLPPMSEQKTIISLLKHKQDKIVYLKKTLTEQSSYINALSFSILRQAFQGKL